MMLQRPLLIWEALALWVPAATPVHHHPLPLVVEVLRGQLPLYPLQQEVLSWRPVQTARLPNRMVW